MERGVGLSPLTRGLASGAGHRSLRDDFRAGGGCRVGSATILQGEFDDIVGALLLDPERWGQSRLQTRRHSSRAAHLRGQCQHKAPMRISH